MSYIVYASTVVFDLLPLQRSPAYAKRSRDVHDSSDVFFALTGFMTVEYTTWLPVIRYSEFVMSDGVWLGRSSLVVAWWRRSRADRRMHYGLLNKSIFVVDTDRHSQTGQSERSVCPKSVRRPLKDHF